MERDVKIKFIGSNGGEPEHAELYERWQCAMKIAVVGENALVECVNSLSFTVKTRLVGSLKSRIDPHMTTASRRIPLPTTWIAVEDMCKNMT